MDGEEVCRERRSGVAVGEDVGEASEDMVEEILRETGKGIEFR